MLKVGDKVRIEGHSEWPEGATGTIAKPEQFMLELANQNEWQGPRRVMQGRSKIIISYHVVFDEPYDDGSGDGPYRSAEVDETYLRIIK